MVLFAQEITEPRMIHRHRPFFWLESSFLSSFVSICFCRVLCRVFLSSFASSEGGTELTF